MLTTSYIQRPQIFPAFEPARICLLDDSSFDRTRIRRHCQDTGLFLSFKEVGSITDFKLCLEEEAFDLFLLDYYLPDGTGLDARDIIQHCPLNKNAPSLLISGTCTLPEDATFSSTCGLTMMNKRSLDRKRLHQVITDALHGPWPQFAVPAQPRQKVAALI